MKSETGPYAQRQGDTERRGQPSRSVGGRSSKQRESLARLIWWMHPAPHTHQNLKSLYRALNWVQSHSHSRCWFTHQLLSHGYVLENSSYCGNSGQKVYSKDRGCRGSDYPAPAQRSTGGHILSMNSSNSKAWKLGELHLASSPLQGLPRAGARRFWLRCPPPDHCCTWENLTSTQEKSLTVFLHAHNT